MLLNVEIEKLLRSNGVYDVGFARVADSPCGLDYAVSIVAALSDAVVDEIDSGDATGGPTHTYFHHYRTVNAFIDNMLLRAGLLLQSAGYRYVPVAASQTINAGGTREHMGRYSHKKAAVLAGLGSVGKSALFLHRELGPRVRLGTLFTDCPLTEANTAKEVSVCGACRLCADACPAKAIKGVEWRPGALRDELFDAKACNDYMRAHFMNIGRGSVCGICMKVCPKGYRDSIGVL
jgi:epoxyqueuosine reductase QueG